MQLKQIYYGVVGAGHIGNYHAQQINNISSVTLQGIYDLSSSQAEKVASLHLQKLGVKLTKLSEEQSDYIGISKNGPFKPDHYRY